VKISADRIVSLSAIFVSLGTLFVILYQTSLMREAQKASVMPYLKISYTFNNDYQKLILANDGLGPAKIEGVRIIEGSDVLEVDPLQYIREKYRGHDLGISNIDLAAVGRLIAADERLEMIRLDNSKSQNYVINTFIFPEEMTFMFDSIQLKPKAYLEIEYSSVYGDKWVVRSNEEVPQEL